MNYMPSINNFMPHALAPDKCMRIIVRGNNTTIYAYQVREPNHNRNNILSNQLDTSEYINSILYTGIN